MNTLEQYALEFIKWLEGESATLGVIEKPADARDFTLDDIAPPAATPPPAFVPYIYNQNQEPACGAHMMAQLINFLNPGVTSSPEFIWDQIRLLDKLPATSGSNIRTVFKAGQNSGACDLALMPNNTTLSNALYASPANITKAEVINALPRRITFYGFGTPTSWANLQQIVNLYGMVGAQINLGTEFYMANGVSTWNPNLLFPLKNGTPVDDHFLVLISATVAEKFGIVNPNPAFQYFVNSWSDQWGEKGLGWFDETYMSHIVEIGACSK